MPATRCILLRHGETVWNLEGRYQGQLDTPLTPVGVAQAEALGERLAGRRFSALYSSDLPRAQATAAAIAARTGHEVWTDARLRERHLGVFQGLRRMEVEQRFPKEFARFRHGGQDYAVPGGESVRQSADRVVACLDELAQRHAGEELVIVTHGGVLGVFLRHVLGVEPDAPRHFKRFNGSWNVFAWENGTWWLETWGDVSHLAKALSLDDV